MTELADGAGSPGDVVIDASALGRWMDARDLPGAGLPAEARLLSGGRQNEIFEIRRGGFRAALRKPPAAAPAETP